MVVEEECAMCVLLCMLAELYKHGLYFLVGGVKFLDWLFPGLISCVSVQS
jgi:hypothetical protein